MIKSEYRESVLKKIKMLESEGRFNEDVEDDPVSIELLPNKVDYLNEKLSSKIACKFANIVGTRFFEKMIKNNQFIIDKIVGIDNFLSVEGGAIITSNHFNITDNYAIWRTIKPYMNGKMLYKVIKEGNYTNPPKPFGFIMKNCNTLPLSSNTETMKKFFRALEVLLKRGEKILVYPEQSMWWNYKKPRPYKEGAFRFAVSNNVPIIPVFISMEDSDILDNEGYYVQKLTIHFMKPIYKKEELSKRENIEFMRKENFKVCVQKYEEVYGEKYNLIDMEKCIKVE